MKSNARDGRCLDPYFLGVLFLHVLLIFLIAVEAKAFITADNDTCDVRYKLRSSYNHSYDCDTISIPGCNESFLVAYNQFPPYIFKDNKSGKVTGILYEFMEEIVHTCCFGCGTFETIGPLEGNDIFLTNASLILPVRTSKSNKHFLGDDFFYLSDLTGVTFMKEKEFIPPEVLSKKMLTAIADTWPLFAIAFIMSLLSGVIVWLLDMCFNTEHFPMSFPLGIFEGFWWAFVSMTTVGYGDRAPKSFMARLFAMVWIFVGITICAMYTATLTSALSEAVSQDGETILAKKIAVLNSTTEGRLATLKESALAVDFSSIDDILVALHERSVEGVAMDDYITSYYLHDMIVSAPDLHFIKKTAIENQVYGVAVPPNKKDISILIESFFSHNEDQRDLMLSEIVQHYQKAESTPVVEEHIQIFSVNSPIFSLTMYGSGVAIGVGGLIGLIMVLIQRRFRRGENMEEIIENGYGKGHGTLNDMDIRFAQEAKALCKKWRMEIENNPH